MQGGWPARAAIARLRVMDLHTFVAWLFDLQRKPLPSALARSDFEDTSVTVYTRSPDDEREAIWPGAMQEA
jgi:hypothetical protein